MRHHLNRLAILATTLPLASAALAFVLLDPPRRWFPADTPRIVTVDSGGMASVTDADRGVSAAVNASEWWNGGGVTVVDARSGSAAYQLGDGLSDIVFSDPLNICKGSCLAATTVGYYDDAQTGTCDGLAVVRITDADVAFNTRYAYTTQAESDGCSSEFYLESVTAHEVGHVIGLGHSGATAALMYPSISSCVLKGIDADDTAGRDALYNCTFSSGGGTGCDLGQPGDACTANGDCCSNSCKGKPGGKTCR
jgi:hypothetical protein